jgi:DnaK suppressor protein
MPVTPPASLSRLAPEELQAFDLLLTEHRTEITDKIQALADTFAGVQGARGDGLTDGAHDAEASSLRTEWSRMSKFQGEFEVELAAIDRALARVADGSYGFCTRNGERIGQERLEYRPAADLCIACARQLENADRR